MEFSQFNFNNSLRFSKKVNRLKTSINAIVSLNLTNSKQDIFDELINLFSIEFKKYENELLQFYFFEKLFCYILDKLSSNTYLSIERAFYFLEQFITFYNEQIKLNQYSDINKISMIFQKQIEIIGYYLLTSNKIAFSFVLNLQRDNSFSIFSLDKDLIYSIQNESYFLNSIFNSIIYNIILKCDLPEIDRIIPLIFKSLHFSDNNIQNNSDSMLKTYDTSIGNSNGFSNILLFKNFTRSIFDIINHYRAFNDSSSVSFLQFVYEQYLENNDDYISNSFTVKMEDLLFNNKIKDVDIKTNNLIRIIQHYFNIEFGYDNNKNNVLLGVLNFTFSFLYLNQHFSTPNSKNEIIPKKQAFSLFIDYLNYSCFILDFLRLNQDYLMAHASDIIKYHCFYNYLEYSGRISLLGFFVALASCYFIKEIILSFKFSSSLPKVLFNFCCYLYQIKRFYKSYSLLFDQFVFFINDIIKTNSKNLVITPYNELCFLYMQKYSIIDKLSTSLPNINTIDISLHLKTIIKKIKYVHIYEQEILLDYIYHIINDETYYQIIISDEDIMKKINHILSFLIFNHDFISIDETDSNFSNMSNMNNLLIHIFNKLLIVQQYEFFYFPKNIDLYLTFDKFLNYILEKNKKNIINSSIVSYVLLSCHYFIEEYYNSFKRQVIPSIFYNNDLYGYIFLFLYINHTFIKSDNETFYKSFEMQLIDMVNFIFENNKTSKNIDERNSDKKIIILKQLIYSGMYHLQLAYFILYNSLTLSNCPYTLILKYFEMMIQSQEKFHLYYLVSIIKFLDNMLWRMIEKKEGETKRNKNINVHNILKTKVFPSNYSAEFKNKFLVLFNFYDNWNKVKKLLHQKNIIKQIIVSLHKRNFPISCINIIEKEVYDYMRNKNITSIIQYQDKEIIQIYAKCVSKIDDNTKLMKSYFMNKSLLNTILGKKEISTENESYLNLLESLFLTDNISLLYKDLLIIARSTNIKPELNCDFYYLKKIVLLLSIIVDLLFDNMYSDFIENINEIKLFTYTSVSNYLNKTQEEKYGSNSFILIIYEIINLIETIEISNTINKDINKVIHPIPNEFIHNTLTNIILKSKLPYLSKYLFHFKIRKIICFICKEKKLELLCIRDIIKTIKKSSNHSTIKNKEMINYLSVYRKLIIEISKTEEVDIHHLYICLKYHYLFCDGQFEEFNTLYSLYLQKSISMRDPKFEILLIKHNERIGGSKLEINKELLKFITNNNNTKDTSFCIKAHYFLTNFYLINQAKFEMIKTDISINQISIDKIDIGVFDYIKIAIMICVNSSDDNKLLPRYLPEIMNYFYKIQLAFQNSGVLSNSSIIKKKSLYKENIEIMKTINVNKLDCILPQLVMAYCYPKTPLYDLSVSLLSAYGEKYIDKIAFLLGSFLSSNPEDNKYFVSSSSSRHSSILNKYSENIILSKTFANDVINQLTDRKKKVLQHYVDFQTKLKEFFLIMKNKTESDSKKISLMQNVIDEINGKLLWNNSRIILPTLDNINHYNPIVRETDLETSIMNLTLTDIIDTNKDKKKNKKKRKTGSSKEAKISTSSKEPIIIDNNTLYICEMDSNYEILDSKEKPLKIRFKACLFHENIKTAKNIKSFYFLLKGDLQDISKELKTFELLNAINNLLKIKHYDTNLSMKLRRYLISPISSQIVIAEWLTNTEPLYNIFTSLLKKNCIDITQCKDPKNASLVKADFIKNLPESYNLLYQYIHYKNPNPNDWYNYQRKFIISSAVWSITGFLIGLGDRHPGNIMLSNNGEIVHIDFGYVLGKGRSLPIPEIVDFRFTKNIRRSLGLFEENGLFIYIGTKMINMFKEYYTMLRGRLEYFALDPFFIKDSDRETFNTLDEMNTFFGENNTIENTEMKVYQLILKNKNDDRLGQMFIGWSPML